MGDGTAVRVFAVGGNLGISLPTRCNESSPRPARDGDPPLFAGAGSVSELASCSQPPVPSVRLDWIPGTDATPPVVYDVYRGTSPLFDPDPATLIASRVSGTSYVDTLQPADCFQSFWYVVRAEDSASPPNVETNTNRLQVDVLCRAPAPPTDVGNVVRAAKDLAGLPALDWSMYVPGADLSHYHVRRTVSKRGLPGSILSEPAARSWLDTFAPGAQYLFRSAPRTPARPRAGTEPGAPAAKRTSTRRPDQEPQAPLTAARRADRRSRPCRRVHA